MNVTPLIDVVMCLIIFYLMVGHLASGRAGDVRLPTAATGATPERATTLVINVVPREPAGAEGGATILLGDEEVAGPELVARLREREALSPGLEVQIRADRTLTYGAVAPILAACREAGLLSVRLVAQRGGDRP